MAIYTTFFLCKPQELTGGFPGWRPPLPFPLERTIKHPFTGQVITVVNRAPVWPNEEVEQPSAKEGPGWLEKGPFPPVVKRALMVLVQLFERPRPLAGDFHIVSITGSYEDYLENRLPPFVRARPHLCWKGITEIELKELCKAAGVEVEIDIALYSPPMSGDVLLQVHDALLSKLALLDEASVEAMAADWASNMSGPEHMYAVAGNKISDGWSLDEALDILEPLASLARRKSDGDAMYLLIEV